MVDRRAAPRDTLDELHDLLAALDVARSAVQTQLDAHVTRDVGKRCVCVSV